MNEQRLLTSLVSSLNTTHLSRRQMLKSSLVLGVGSMLLVACGDDEDDTEPVDEPDPEPVDDDGEEPADEPEEEDDSEPVDDVDEEEADDETPDAAAGGSIRIGIGVDALTMDPHNYRATVDLQIADLVYDTLVGSDPETLELTPRLATSWEAIEDDTWEVHLRDDVVFTDGSAFDGEVVRFNIERAQNAPPAGSYVSPIADVEVVDDYTVLLHTNGPIAATMRNLSVPIMSMVSPSADVEADDNLEFEPIGSGMFVLTEWEPRERIVLQPNPDYWGDAPLLDQVEFLPIPDADTRLSAYRAGDIHVVADPPAEEVAGLEGDSDNQVFLAPATRTIWLGVNTSFDMLQDESVRQAVAMAVDREILVDAVAEGLVRHAEGLVPPEILTPDFDLPHTYDPDAARDLLAESGFPDGFEIELWTPEGRYTKDRDIAEVIQQQLSEIGITASMSVVEWGPYLESLGRQEGQLFIIGWGFSSSDPDGGLRQISQSESSFNYTAVNEEWLDQGLNEAAAELDIDARAALYNELQYRLLDEAMFIPIYHAAQIVVARSNVQNLVVHPLERMDLATTSIAE